MVVNYITHEHILIFYDQIHNGLSDLSSRFPTEFYCIVYMRHSDEASWTIHRPTIFIGLPSYRSWRQGIIHCYWEAIGPFKPLLQVCNCTVNIHHQIGVFIKLGYEFSDYWKPILCQLHVPTQEKGDREVHNSYYQ